MLNRNITRSMIWESMVFGHPIVLATANTSDEQRRGMGEFTIASYVVHGCHLESGFSPGDHARHFNLTVRSVVDNTMRMVYVHTID